MAKELVDKNAVVTGAAGEIGREICRVLLEQGARVLGLDLRECGSPLPGATQWRFLPVDLADPEALAATCRQIREEMPRLDVLVNNAAIYSQLRLRPLQELSLQEWDRVMQVNVRGPWLLVRELLPPLRNAKGSIINIASGSALRGSPFLLHYVASKGALLAMTKAMATELGGHGIRVNALAPGLVNTRSSQSLGPQFPQILQSTVRQQAIQLPLLAEEVAAAVLFLASDWSRAVTGQTIPVDRGLIKL